jgi:hypothetical protein
MTAHPSDDTILRQVDMTVDEYRKRVNEFSGRILH